MRIVILLSLVMLFNPIVGVATAYSSAAICPQPDGKPPAITYTPDSQDDIKADFAPQILHYLNTTGSAEGLQDALAASNPNQEQPLVQPMVVVSDVTADGTDDVVVDLNLSYGSSYQSLLAVFGCQNGDYVLLDSLVQGDFSDIQLAPSTQIVAVIDMNGDGPQEIITRNYSVSQKVFETVFVYSWKDDKLQQIFSSGYQLGGFGDIEIKNVTGDSRQLELLMGAEYGYGQATAAATIEIFVWRPVNLVYQWDDAGTTLSLFCQYFTDEPTKRYQVLHSAELYASCGMYPQALADYERLIQDDSLEGWSGEEITPPIANIKSRDQLVIFSNQAEKDYLAAFAYYRMAQIDLITGDSAAASGALKDALAAYPAGSHGYEYVAMLDALIKQYDQSGDLGDACKAASGAFADVRQQGRDPQITYIDDGNQNYGDTYGYYWDSGNIDSPNPDNLFKVPDSIADLLTMPVCWTPVAGVSSRSGIGYLVMSGI